MGAANVELSPNPHVSDHVLSLCSDSSFETSQTSFKEILEAQPSELTTPATPSTLRQQQPSSVPTPHSWSTKLSSLKQFYQKKFCKNSCSTEISRADGDCLKQRFPLQTEEPYSKSSIVGLGAPTSSIGSGDNQKTPTTKRFTILPKRNTMLPCGSVRTRSQTGNESLDPDLPRCSPTWSLSSKLSSEAQSYKTTNSSKPPTPNVESFDNEDYQKYLKNVMLDCQESSTLKSCPSQHCSTGLSSLDTSLSGSFYSQDSAFSVASVFPTGESTSPVEPALRAQQESGVTCHVEIPSSSPGLATDTPPETIQEPLGGQAHLHPVTLHPRRWLRSCLASLKKWSLRKRTQNH